MNSELPLTRRDVVALVTYAAMAPNVVGWLVQVLCRVAFTRISWLQFPPPGGGVNLSYYWLGLGISVTVTIAFCPFVSLIARAVTGRSADDSINRRNLFSLMLPCVGVILFISSVPSLPLTLYSYLTLPIYENSNSAEIKVFHLQSIVLSGAILSVGFVLAFFPAIFETLLVRVRDEQSAD